MVVFFMGSNKLNFNFKTRKTQKLALYFVKIIVYAALEVITTDNELLSLISFLVNLEYFGITHQFFDLNYN